MTSQQNLQRKLSKRTSCLGGANRITDQKWVDMVSVLGRKLVLKSKLWSWSSDVFIQRLYLEVKLSIQLNCQEVQESRECYPYNVYSRKHFFALWSFTISLKLPATKTGSESERTEEMEKTIRWWRSVGGISRLWKIDFYIFVH